MARIQAKELPIHEIFSNDYAFEIPYYQRPYRWGIDQSDQLLKDVLEAAQSARHQMSRASATVEPYFLGSLILAKTSNLPESEVVDGQQRLTTLALLLAALRAMMTDQNADDLGKLLFEEGSKLLNRRDRCRLTLRPKDHPYFRQLVLSDPTLSQLRVAPIPPNLPEAQANLTRNGQHLLTAVSALSAVDRELLASFLLQHTYLVVVATESLESAFRIFSVLNDRGLDLTAADILKAEITGKITHVQELEEYTEKWEDLDQSLSGDNFDRLLGHIVMIHHRQKLKGTMLKAFRQVVRADERPKEFIDEELVPYAEAYTIIRNANYEGNQHEKINRTLRHLERLDERDWVPPALMLLVHQKNDPARLTQSLADLERLSVVLWLRRADVNDRIERYGKLLGEIAQNTDLTLPGSALQLSAAEMQDAVRVLDGDIYNLSPKPKRTMILLRLDEALSSGEANYDHHQITVEHVLPQKPQDQSEWLVWWPDAEQRRVDTHRLGNLALLNRRQNSAARNWPLATKQSRYFTTRGGSSPFVITSEVVGQKEWTPSIFAERQRRFVDKLRSIWRLEGNIAKPTP